MGLGPEKEVCWPLFRRLAPSIEWASRIEREAIAATWGSHGVTDSDTMGALEIVQPSNAEHRVEEPFPRSLSTGSRPWKRWASLVQVPPGRNVTPAGVSCVPSSPSGSPHTPHAPGPFYSCRHCDARTASLHIILHATDRWSAPNGASPRTGGSRRFRRKQGAVPANDVHSLV